METGLGFSFRKLLPDDVPVIFDLHQQWFPIRIEDEFYRLLLSDTYYCIVATHSGNRAEQEIVGFLSAQSDWSTDDIPVANRRDSMMYISSMGVTESVRHKGLGSMLLHQLLEHCRKEKFAAIFLHVIVTNGGAIRSTRNTTSKGYAGWQTFTQMVTGELVMPFCICLMWMFHDYF